MSIGSKPHTEVTKVTAHSRQYLAQERERKSQLLTNNQYCVCQRGNREKMKAVFKSSASLY